MGGRRIALLLALAAAAAGIAILASSRRGDGPSPRAGPEAGSASPASAGPDTPADSPRGSDPAFYATPPGAFQCIELGLALSRGDEEGARAAAAALRRLLRTDPAARERAAAILLDPVTDPVLRRALALVFGTFGGPANDALLLEVLRRFPGDAALVRCALLALGGTREPEEDDDVFGLGDRPWGAKGPGGIGITVRREIADAEMRRGAAAFLARTEAEVREASATALRHSVAQADVREAFLLSLGREREDGVAAVLGETLAARAGRAEDPGERQEIVGALLARAGEEGLDAYRFRTEDDLGTVPLDGPQRARLLALAGAEYPFGVRSFALTALARSASRSGDDAVGEARAHLAALVGKDADAAVRDLAARLLRFLPFEEAAAGVLAAAARGDAAWNVRFTAVETLASFGSKPGVAEALDAASGDADARVANRAQELRRGP